MAHSVHCLLPTAYCLLLQVHLTSDELARRERQAGADPVALVQLVSLADEDSAHRLRRRVFELLRNQKANASAADLHALAAKLAVVLPQAIHSPEEARELLGPPRQVSRQILYRRYLEQWEYDRPIPLYLRFGCRTGETSHLQSVQLNRSGKL
jgi:hypothetical protein